AVIARETPNQDHVLYAYITPDPAHQIETDSLIPALKEYVSQQMPAYMVPSGIVTLEQLPRNPNGKIDYQRLPDPFEGEETQRIAPRDEIETRLLEVWSQLLKVREIGVTHSFFSSGGSSLTAMSLTHKIHKEFHVRLELETLFQNPTIEEQANLIRSAANVRDEYASIGKAPDKDYYDLSAAQKRLYVVYNIDPQSTAYNLFKTVMLEGNLDPVKLEDTFKRLIRRHESFRTSFTIRDEHPVQVIHSDAPLTVRFSRSSPRDAPHAVETFLRPFDLSQAPLMRVGVIRVRQDRHILIVDVHHIVSDGTSLGILVNDFMRLYKGEQLPPLRLRYKDYSHWQNRLLQSGAMDRQETFWLKELEGELPVLNLPLDFQRPQIPGFREESISFSLGEELSAKVKQAVDETRTTLHIFLLAVYNVLLSKHSGQEDILVGSGIIGRPHQDLRDIIGMFVNMLVMRNRPNAEKTFGQFLQDVKTNALRAYENQDYQFHHLVMKLGIERRYGRNPVFDTEFTFHNVEIDPLDIPGLEVSSVDYEKRVTQFDLSLNGTDTGETVMMKFTYAAELFKESTVRALKDHYLEILEQVVENRAAPLKDIAVSLALVDGKSDLSMQEAMDFGF
ncbi:MAG: non-ribosomal peptide synthetase, partial [bacterium]|nr:non-ribosomal peptide synthetase [bacterium]